MREKLTVLLFFCFLMPSAAPSRAAQPGEASVSSVRDGPVYGDAMIRAMLGEPTNLIPYLSSDSPSSEAAGHFYVAPLKYDRDLRVVPWAAERFEILDEGRRLRFTLRKGIFWQDGTELTAADAAFTHAVMTDPKTPTAYAGDFTIIKEFKQLDRYSFEVFYEKPFPRSLNTWMGALLPAHALSGQDLRSTPLIRNPLSCGPYVLREWDSGSRLVMASNPAYFPGRPYIDRVIYRIIPDVATMFLELKAGKLDVMGSLTGLQYTRQTGDAEFRREFGVLRTPASAYTYMGYNLKSPLFSDVRVRRALAHAVNKRDIIKTALMGQGEPTIGPYKPDAWAYNHAVEDYPYDPEKALALLEEAGWQKGSDGMLRKDGRIFSFTLLTNQGNEQRIKTAVIIRSMLRKVGMDVTIRSVEWAVFIKQFVMSGRFDAVILGWTIPHDPDGYDVWHSSRRDGGLNFVGYADAEADACLEAARSTLDQDVRKKNYDRFQEILHRDQPYCFLYVPYDLTAVQRRFRGMDPAPAGILYNVDQWWVPLDEQRYRISAQ